MSRDKNKPDVKVNSVKRVFDGFFKVDQYNVTVDRHDGGTFDLTRLVFERGHAVAVLAYDPKADSVLLINEMRPGILATGEYPYTETLPAGGIDKGETPIEAARREMREETGMEIDNPVLVHSGAYVSPGGTSEKISIVFATVDMSRAGGVHGHADEGESIKTVVTAAADFIARADSGQLTDLKTVAAAYWLARHRAREKARKVTPKAGGKSGRRSGPK